MNVLGSSGALILNVLGGLYLLAVLLRFFGFLFFGGERPLASASFLCASFFNLRTSWWSCLLLCPSWRLSRSRSETASAIVASEFAG